MKISFCVNEANGVERPLHLCCCLIHNRTLPLFADAVQTTIKLSLWTISLVWFDAGFETHQWMIKTTFQMQRQMSRSYGHGDIYRHTLAGECTKLKENKTNKQNISNQTS